MNRGFTPRMIGQLETHVRELTTGILDEALGWGEGDFVVDVAAELPLESSPSSSACPTRTATRSSSGATG